MFRSFSCASLVGVAAASSTRRPSQSRTWVRCAARVGAFGRIEGEHPDVGRLQDLRVLQGAAQAVELLLEVAGERKLAEWRADGGEADAVIGRPPFDVADLGGAERQHVPSPGAAELDVVHVVSFELPDLDIRIVVDLVREGADHVHGAQIAAPGATPSRGP